MGAPLASQTRGGPEAPPRTYCGNHSGGQHKLLEHHGIVVFVFEHLKGEKLFNMIEVVAGDVELQLII